MGNVPVLKPAEVVAILRKLGFAEVRQRGSHKQALIQQLQSTGKVIVSENKVTYALSTEGF